MFYKRKERTLRVSIFFGGAALAGAFGGILGETVLKLTSSLSTIATDAFLNPF